jgi:hypothetical protein
MVFGRLGSTDALSQLGTVRATNDDLASSYARTTYDEDKWIEMVVVRRDAVITVLTQESGR